MKVNPYPRSPVLESYDFLKPSPKFKKVAITVVLSILFFFLFYLALIAIAIILMMAAGWAGFKIITFKPNIITIALGGGLSVLGLMIFVFLIKFIFASKRAENPYRIRITESDHPQLFKFIKYITNDTGTVFPKKIFVSPEVNAGVFYNSNFWSLFLPVRKNLEIGLGLVNAMNVSEFKAIMSHEFGHFSQKSMKLGAYIYTLNNMIYNLVYEYDNWDKTLESWAESGGIFGFFARVTFWIAESVRAGLRVAYNLINVNYMKLSREMEYHADLVAVKISGNKSVKNALRKTEFSGTIYNFTIVHLQKLASKERSSSNIYKDLSFCMSYIAHLNKIANTDGTLNISDEVLDNLAMKPRVNIEDQWSSHPTRQERELNMSKINIECERNTDPAWVLFNNAEELQKKATKVLYEVGYPDSNFKELKKSEFENFLKTEINKYRLSEKYNGYYDGRYLTTFKPEEIGSLTTTKSFDEIYSKGNSEKIQRLELNRQDLQILRQISSRQIKTKYFDFDGRKYRRKDAEMIIKELESDIKKGEKFLESLDRESYIFNLQNAKYKNSDSTLIGYYKKYFLIVKDLAELESIVIEFERSTSRLFSPMPWSDEEYRQFSSDLSFLEGEIKNFLRGLDLVTMTKEMESDINKNTLEEYLSSETEFFHALQIDNESFVNFSEMIYDIYESYKTQYFQILKELTDYQLTLLD